MSRRKLKGLRILVTGASSGIGRELAMQLAQRGAHVLATARSQSKLEELTHKFPKNPSSEINRHSISILSGDITDPKFRQSLHDWCQQNWQQLDVLINNAGAGAIGRFADAEPNRLRQIMEIDFIAPVELTRIMLPLLRQGTSPAIMNIGSVLGYRAVPMKSEYSAAKFALRGWSEAIRCELAAEKIDVLHVSPSTTRSNFFNSLIDTHANQKSHSIGSMTPNKVASIAIKALIGSKRERIISIGGRLLVWGGWFVPGILDRCLRIRHS